TEAADRHGRHLCHAQPFCRFTPSVAREDGAGLVDQNWVGPEAPDAFHQGGNLTFWVPPRVAWKFLQLANRTPDHMVHKTARLPARGALSFQQGHDHTSPTLADSGESRQCAR